MMRSVLDFQSAVVAIVKYRQRERTIQKAGEVPQVLIEAEQPQPGKFYSVSITPENPQQLSPSREFIRFGDVAGDELAGWQRVSDLEVCEVIAFYDKGEPIKCISGAEKWTARGERGE